jgi:sugar/nucleoside kinase (ribokinase family)
MSQAADVLCCGIIVSDHICTPISHLPSAGELVTADRILLTLGGCAANAAVDLVKMGVNTRVVGRVGKDVFGRVVAEMLREAGIDVSGLKFSTTADTSQTLIVNVAGQDRRFVHCFGANAEFTSSDIPTEDLSRCKVLYVGGYLAMPALRQEDLIPSFIAARKAGAKTVLDVVTPGKGEHLSKLDKLLPHVDVFLPNNHEGELMTGEKDPFKQAEVFRRLGAGTVVITMGGEGSVVVHPGGKLRAGTYPIEYIDGSGGGDAFDAGYIYGLLHGLGVEDCLKVASALGASCVRAIGTTPGVFTKPECEEFMRKHTLKIERV